MLINCKHCNQIFDRNKYSNTLYCSDACRFFEYFIPGDPDSCWIWNGPLTAEGYGCFGNGRSAHRFAHEHFIGPRTKGLVIRHLCNNPGCVNPKHLKEGTPKENVQDQVDAGTFKSNVGTNNPAARLTEDDVREIYESAETHEAVGSRFSVDKCTISDIRSNRTWTHITENLVKGHSYQANRKKKLTAEVALAIYNSSKSYSNISREFNTSISTVADIKQGKTWTHVTQGK